MSISLTLRPLVEEGTRGLLEFVDEAIVLYEALSGGINGFNDLITYAQGLVELLTLKTYAAASVPARRKGPKSYAKKIFAIKKRSKTLSREQIQFLQDRLEYVCGRNF
jgi:hypothetical protein